MFENGYEGWLNNSAINSSYLEETKQKKKPIDCMWIVNVTEEWKVREGFLS
jgi:recombination DNA repair RAD52 pathway protein